MRVTLPEPISVRSLSGLQCIEKNEGIENLSVTGISTDSNDLCPGDLFLALQGEKVDGNAYIEDALRKGALLAVSDTRSGERILRCTSMTALLYEMATMRLREVAPNVVAVTGSVGKSTFLSYAATLLERKMRLHRPSGNYNTDVGLPMTILCMPRETETLLLEMGARHPGDVGRLSILARPHIAIITCIGHSHLETLHDQNGVLRAKSEILLGLQKDGALIYNADDPLLSAWAKRICCRRIGVSIRDDTAEVSLIKDPVGIGYQARYREQVIAEISLYDESDAARLSAALAIATALLLDLPHDVIRDALPLCRAPAMRRQRIMHNGILYIMDAYNASPESSIAALHLLAESKSSGAKVAVLGDMLELGENESAFHRDLGKASAEIGLTSLYLIGKNAESIKEGAVSAGMIPLHIHVFASDEKRMLADELTKSLKPGDVLLLKASRALRLETVLSALTDGNY